MILKKTKADDLLGSKQTIRGESRRSQGWKRTILFERERGRSWGMNVDDPHQYIRMSHEVTMRYKTVTSTLIYKNKRNGIVWFESKNIFLRSSTLVRSSAFDFTSRRQSFCQVSPSEDDLEWVRDGQFPGIWVGLENLGLVFCYLQFILGLDHVVQIDYWNRLYLD